MVKENQGHNITENNTVYSAIGAVNGDALSHNALGDDYFYGNNVKQSYRKAVKHYRKAAEAGYDVAQYNLGYCYEEGLGVFKSGRKAFHWYSLAAEQGNAKALNNLGNCYAWGYGTPQDKQEAFECYSMSAEKGYEWGEYNLAECYDEGFGVKKNRKEAMRLYALAAAQGNSDAAKAMQPKARFRRWLLRISKHLIYIIGTILFLLFIVSNYYDAKAYELYLEGVEAYSKKDYSKAIILFDEAIEQGSAEAMNYKGICYENGFGVKKDKEKAYECFKSSADDDCPQGIYNLARFYEHGKVVKKDLEEAVRLYRKSMEMDNPESKRALERLKRI